MLKTYRYRLYPNSEQKQCFAHHFGCARWTYNWALDKKQSHYKETQKNLSKRDLQDQLVVLKKTEEKKWLNGIRLEILKNTSINCVIFFYNKACE